MPPGLSLFFPVFNEEKNLPLLHRNVRRVVAELRRDQLVGEHETIYIDDGSSDGSAAVLDGIAARDSRVRVIRSEENRGYGHAVNLGIRIAAMEHVFFSDSDNQFALEDIRLLLQALDGVDFVIGHRQRRRDPAHRRLYAELFRRLVYLRFGTLFRDVNCAFKLFRRSALRDIELTSEGALINAELMTTLIRRGHRFAEVPVRHFPRRYGRQGGGDLRVILMMLKEISTIRVP